MHALDDVGEEVGDGEHRELVQVLIGIERNGIGDDDFLQGAVVDALVSGPESTGCVMAARTLLAPRAMSMSAAMQMVPAVSIMSSTMRMLRPSTSPMAVILPTTLALARSLCEMMMGVPNSLA